VLLLHGFTESMHRSQRLRRSPLSSRGHDWGGGIAWALAMPSPLHGQLTNFLVLFHYCDG